MNLQKIILSIFIGLFSITSFADVSVDGYNRKDGTYVQPHYRSDPNNTSNDNWSTKGNTNPYTGQEGTHERNNNSWSN
jgi:hypothetical protein